MCREVLLVRGNNTGKAVMRDLIMSKESISPPKKVKKKRGGKVLFE